MRKLLWIFAFVGGCASTTQPHKSCQLSVYHPWVAPVNRSAAALGTATERVLAARGFSHITSLDGGTRFVAEVREPLETRERAVIDVRDRELLVDVRTEVADDRGQWLSASAVCEGYSYVREGAMADAIAAAARGDR